MKLQIKFQNFLIKNKLFFFTFSFIMKVDQPHLLYSQNNEISAFFFW